MSLRECFTPISRPRRAALVIACASLAAAGCSSAPWQSDSGTSYAANLAGAESAVQNADEARAADFSPTEMRAAHAKLDASHAAVLRHDLKQAVWLSDEAAINADIATARANRAKALAAMAAANDNTPTP